MIYLKFWGAVFGLAMLLCIAVALRDIADAQIAIASDGCYDIPENIHAAR
jgi:hypothetical protein